jgi:hypothetical protein
MAENIIKMIEEFSSRSNTQTTTTAERKRFYECILKAMKQYNIQDFPKKPPGAKYEGYLTQLKEYLKSLVGSKGECNENDAETDEDECDIELLPEDIVDDEKGELRQSERILQIFPSLPVIDGKWIDLENIFLLPLEFHIQKNSVKKRLRRQNQATKRTVGFRVSTNVNNHFGGKIYYVHKQSIFTLLCQWNVLAFKSSIALESKLNMTSNQYLEKIVEEVRECVISGKQHTQSFRSREKDEEESQNEIQIRNRMFQLFNKFEDFMMASEEKKSTVDLSGILLDIRQNNASLIGICQKLLTKYEIKHAETQHKLESLQVVLRKGGADIRDELKFTLNNHLRSIEQSFLGDLMNHIRQQHKESQELYKNMQGERNQQLIELYQALTSYHTSAFITLQTANSKTASDIKNDISSGYCNLLQAVEKLQNEYQKLCQECTHLVKTCTFQITPNIQQK